MPKLPLLTSRELLKRLKHLGFVIDHQTGSHIILYHPTSRKRAVIAHHLKTIPKGTLISLLREAGLTKDDLATC